MLCLICLVHKLVGVKQVAIIIYSFISLNAIVLVLDLQVFRNQSLVNQITRETPPTCGNPFEIGTLKVEVTSYFQAEVHPPKSARKLTEFLNLAVSSTSLYILKDATFRLQTTSAYTNDQCNAAHIYKKKKKTLEIRNARVSRIDSRQLIKEIPKSINLIWNHKRLQWLP